MSAPPDRNERPEYVNLGPSDWIAGCATLPPMTEWVYWQISLYNMDKGAPVPANRLPMILVRHGGDWQGDLDLLIDLGKVHKTNGGALFVKRSLVEYERANTALQKRRKAGKRGAEKRWNTNGLDSAAIKNDSNAIEKRCDTNGRREEKRREEVDLPSVDTTGAGDLIFSVDPRAMAAFRKHRREIGKPLTAVGEERIVRKLERLQMKHGHDPGAMLRQSIDENWIGVFPVRGDGEKRSGWRFDDE